MSWFSLPSNWVFVYFEGGHCLNVANQDTLSKEEADSFKERWEKSERIVRVDLQNNNGDVLKSYKY